MKVYPIQFSKLEKYAGKNISKKELLNIIEGTLLHKMVSNTLSTQKLNNKIVTNKIKQKKKVTKNLSLIKNGLGYSVIP